MTILKASQALEDVPYAPLDTTLHINASSQTITTQPDRAADPYLQQIAKILDQYQAWDHIPEIEIYGQTEIPRFGVEWKTQHHHFPLVVLFGHETVFQTRFFNFYAASAHDRIKLTQRYPNATNGALLGYLAQKESDEGEIDALTTRVLTHPKAFLKLDSAWSKSTIVTLDVSDL